MLALHLYVFSGSGIARFSWNLAFDSFTKKGREGGRDQVSFRLDSFNAISLKEKHAFLQAP